MKLRTMIAAPIVAVLMLITAYWAFVGFSEQVPDFTPTGTNANPTPANNTPPVNNTPPANETPPVQEPLPYVAYGTFKIVVNLDSWAGFPVVHEILITPNIQTYTGPLTGMVFHRTSGLHQLLAAPPQLYKMWVWINVTGPNGYSSTWLSDAQDVTPSVTLTVTFNTGRAFFADSGGYTLTVHTASVGTGPIPPGDVSLPIYQSDLFHLSFVV